MKRSSASIRRRKPVGRLNDLERILGADLDVDPKEALESLYRLMDAVMKKDALRQQGVTEAELPVFAENVVETQQRLLNNNYVGTDKGRDPGYI